MPIQMIALQCLEPSKRNVRKSSSKSGMEELKASLQAHGLMQNLVVTFGEGHIPTVIAGCRRLEALRRLQAEGKFPKGWNNWIVPCEIVDAEQALELSLAENTVREAMHPIDEFEAYAALSQNGVKPAEIAARFGVTEKHVLGRLKLSRVHENILKAYRAGEINLEKVMAFTITDDQKKQLAAFKDLSDWDEPDDIRAALTEELTPGDSAIARFVGIEEYKNAGGQYRENLFGDEVYYEDPALLKSLAVKKLEKVAASLKDDGWGWVEILPAGSVYEFTRGMTRIWETPKGKAEKALMGVVVIIASDGKPKVEKAFLRKTEAAQLRKKSPERAAAVALPTGKEKGALSEGLKRQLLNYRVQVMQLALAEHPDISTDLMIFHAAIELLGGNDGDGGPDIDFRDQRVLMSFPDAKEPEGTPAGQRLAAIEEELPLDWLKAGKEAQRFAAFRQLTEADKLRLLGYCVAICQDRQFLRADNSTEAALALTGIEVADYWRPSAVNYLGGITREQLVALGESIFGKGWGETWKNAKKGDLVHELDQAFANPRKFANGNAGIEQKLKTWLPDGMAFRPPAAKESGKAPAKRRVA